MGSGLGYTLAEVIHESVNTTVYRGYRNADGLRVGIKRLRSDRPTPTEIAQLRYEYIIARDLALPGVVKVYGVEKVGNNLALVMEDAPGQALNEILGSRKLSTPEALRIAISIAGTLESIHRSGVIHMDIKPHNMIVEMSTMEVKITDFGSSTRLSHETPRLKSAALIEATLAYMSPEQTGRMNRVIDLRTDLYSLGVTIYEMVTGVLPFWTTDVMELVHSHIARQPPAPRQISPSVPAVLSNIVMKLLAKDADARYQCAHGLKVDLVECLGQWASTGDIQPFPLGQRDRVDELRISQKLYGREAELSVLLTAWERVNHGTTELLLVSGYSGIGKSVLVHEIHRAIAQGKGRFGSGKFDQLNRAIPYAAVVHVFRELVRDLLTEPAEVLAVWKSRFEEAVGPSGQLVVDLIPELALILGAQPSVQALGPTESQNRFNLVFQGFCSTFPVKEQPLVLFFDDLQWADPASLKFLQAFLAESGVGHLLLIGAYRDNEVDASHLLPITVSEIRKAGVAVNEIKLRPLDLPVVEQIIAATLGDDAERTDALAKIIFDKTHGNPFFMGQFLKTLHHDKLLSLDPSSRSWTWDLKRIEGMNVTENVVDFMAGKIRQLTPRTQRILTFAACIGHQFDLDTLSAIHGESRHETVRELWGALREGLVLPLDAASRFFSVSTDDEEADGAVSAAGPELAVRYRFLHDRVQQAAYSLLEDERKRTAHLQLGRLMLARSALGPLEGEIFNVVGQMNQGVELLTEPEERLTLTRLNLDAGKRAKSGSAHEAAATYFGVGISLLDPQSWEKEYELTFVLHLELAESRYLSGHFDAADALFDILLSRAKTRLERANVYNASMASYLARGKLSHVVRCGLAALALLGVEIPETPEQRNTMLNAELDAIRSSLAGRSVAELIDMPSIVDPEQRLILKLLAEMAAPAGAGGDVALYGLSIAKQVAFSMKWGNSEMSGYGYVTFAMFLMSGTQQKVGGGASHYEDGYNFAKLGIELNEKFSNVRLTCMLLLMYSSILHFFEPLQATIASFVRARQTGFESGDLTFASYACIHIVSEKLGLGEDLDLLDEEVDQSLTLMQRTHEKMTTLVLTGAKQIIANLKGKTAGRHSFSDDSFDEPAFAKMLESPELGYVASWYYIFKLQLAYIHGDYSTALSFVAPAERLTAGWMNVFWATELTFYTCLTLAALYGAASPAERERYVASLTSHRAKLAQWAELCPGTYEHKRLLVLAEVARISGSEREAMALYDEALDAANASGFVRDEAMTSEICANFYEANGMLRIARAYMTDAYLGYVQWGATSKADDMISRVPHLVPQGARLPASVDAWTACRAKSAQTTSTRRLNTDLLDIETVIQAAQTIAGEVVLENIVIQLMDIVIKNAGAQKGILILERDQRLVVEATITLDPNTITLGQAVPLEASTDLPLSIVHYVERTRVPLVLGDASREPRFASDPYIVAHSPKSMLCLAMVHQGRTRGIFYLENRIANDAFTPARLELVKLLLTQASAAVENARLYEHVQSRSEALNEAEERLKVEFAERERSEQARAALQYEIIQTQNARLEELSTPLIPITERIMVMPLIGAMDRARAQQVLSTALQGVQARRADVVILDITGVKLVDNDVASTLISTASALRLLGAQVVITGIRPEVAQAIVGLQIDFGAVVTRGTLQSGIAYALRLTGKAGRFKAASRRAR